jgi:hypothetical protein
MVQNVIKNETFRKPIYGNFPAELDPFLFVGLFILGPGKMVHLKKAFFLSDLFSIG